MTFAEAMQALQDGKKVRRQGWLDGSWISIGASIFLTEQCCLATDWEIVDEPRPKRKVKMRFYVWRGELNKRLHGNWSVDGDPYSKNDIPTDQVMDIEFEEPEA